ncbi:hypothetical protein [Rhizobium sp. BK176]|uniref:hypothetical protein n=1 Tax=Rhizobium sp. BK176 TaxID=2587071 RepID=UPI002169438F|nr:hypothetical protein [Rhizobium sp. BK176]MCS4089409.1 hypothetical protein [Rhizobium sp. BK176]
MADFIVTKTGDKLFSGRIPDDHLICLGNELDFSHRGTVKRYRIANIVTPVKNRWFRKAKFSEPKIFLDEVERDSVRKVANWL